MLKDTKQSPSASCTINRIYMSAHNLEIEKGKHIGVVHSDTICKLCNSNNIENETHFLWLCECYEQERESLYSKLYRLHNFDYKLINDDNIRSKLLLNSKSHNVLKCMSKFIEDLLNKKNSNMST